MTKLTIAVVLAVAATAHADPKTEAKAHIDAATVAHKASDFATALAELQAAYTIDPQPDLLYAIGQVYAKLGRCAEATASYEDFRKTQKDPAVGKVVDQAIAACKPHEETTTVVTEVKPPPPPPPVEHHRAPWYTDKVGDALVIGGLVAGVVGLVVYTGATGKLDDAEHASSLAAYNQLVDDAHGARTTATILLIGGGGLVIGGVVHYMLRGGSDDAATGVGMVPVSSGGVLTYGGRF